MKNLKVFLIMGMMLLVGGTCFSQQQEDYKKDSIWGISVDTTETDLLLHFNFSSEPFEENRVRSIYFRFYVNIESGVTQSAVIDLWLNATPIGFSSKYAQLVSLEKRGEYYEISLKFDKVYYGPTEAPWNIMRIMFGDYYVNHSFAPDLSSLHDFKSEDGDPYSHRYISMTGQSLNEPPHGEYYVDCMFLPNNRMIDCKKCFSR